MTTPLAAFFITLGTVTLAEMGDKTQLLSMAFAVKYKPIRVFLGVTVATVLLNALAVAAGSLLAQYQALGTWIQLAASLSFIAFGLWSLRGEKEEAEKERKAKFGPVVTVASAFFLAELGDKTQLATVALAAKFPASAVLIFLGSVLGMLVANCLGIFVGAAFCRKLPEKVFRLLSAAVFFLFGLYGVWETAKGGLGIGAAAGITAGLAAVSGLIAWLILRKAARGEASQG